MARRPITKTFTFGGSAYYELSTITGENAKTWIHSLAMRADRENLSDIFWTDENGESGGYIGPAEAVVFDYGQEGSLMKNFRLTGTEDDIVYLTIGMNDSYFDQWD